MKQILMDTNGYVAYMRNRPGAVELVRSVDRIAMNTIIMGELLAGFLLGNQERRNRQALNGFLDSTRVCILPLDTETSEYYARIYKQLRQDGMPIPTNDLWIAATALRHGYAVFTYDRHFSAIKNLISCRTIDEFMP